MKIKSIWLRKIHKWIGLVIGLQFLLWAVSGTAMALLDMGEVAGGPMAERSAAAAPIVAENGWPRVQQALGRQPVLAVTIRRLPRGPVYQVATEQGIQLFGLADGAPVSIGAATAAEIAKAAHPTHAAIGSVEPLRELSLAVRDFELPIWRVDFSRDGLIDARYGWAQARRVRDTRLTELRVTDGATYFSATRSAAAVGTAGGFTALLSAMACCVLPLALALVGLGSGGLAVLVPYHWPLTIAAGLTVATGWALYGRNRLACARSSACTLAPPGRATFVILCFATVFVILSAVWPGYIEEPMMRLLGGA